MAAIEREVVTVETNYECDRCGEHNMRFSGKTDYKLTKRVYYHVCLGCGHRAILNSEYPFITYREKEIENAKTIKDAGSCRPVPKPKKKAAKKKKARSR